ncbi:MAG: phage scaffolding protein [Oscillospiraceae bacterium]|nr:phage scaffolding protein [Oscillospiraceae bacterium]
MAGKEKLMLEWLKGILGDGYTDEVDKKISAEIGKNFVSKTDFNTVNSAKKQLEDALKERDGQLEELKKSSGDNEALRKQIEQLQANNTEQTKRHKAEIERLRIDAAVEAALMSAGAKNTKAAKALLNLEGAKLGADGSVEGLQAQLKTLREGEDTSFMFAAADEKRHNFKGFNPAEGKDKNPKAGTETSNMTYSEICEFLEQNPNAKLE